MPLDEEFKITKIPGSVTIRFASDRLIEATYKDPRTGEVKGKVEILASQLLAGLGEEREDALIAEIGPVAARAMVEPPPNG